MYLLLQSNIIMLSIETKQKYLLPVFDPQLDVLYMDLHNGGSSFLPLLIKKQNDSLILLCNLNTQSMVLTSKPQHCTD